MPSVVRVEMAVDFVEGLPCVGGKSVILTIIDRFSKYAHFVALAFYANVVHVHGVPASIVSDRDPTFMLALWKALFAATRTKLHMSSAFNPQEEREMAHLYERRKFPYLGDEEAVEEFIKNGSALGTTIGPKGFVDANMDSDNMQKQLQ
ncbi:hypothetical protein E2562_038583 [Oryza meyeriana var. granulata]|uniref:Integrase catalytic domain-containing protein n=1 Tax=Oryza meyeriana var. granulata TaxID=110450 RepID=A0A6G1DSC6_9ORYZ|nr:hypothetical protein E2562_038583 [Oryza meyeriana var. granulata]